MVFSHDSSLEEWMNLAVCPLRGPGLKSQSWRSISMEFPLVDHTLLTRPEPAWQKMAQYPLHDTTQPVSSEEEGQSSTMDRQWLNKEVFIDIPCLRCTLLISGPPVPHLHMTRSKLPAYNAFIPKNIPKPDFLPAK